MFFTLCFQKNYKKIIGLKTINIFLVYLVCTSPCPMITSFMSIWGYRYEIDPVYLCTCELSLILIMCSCLCKSNQWSSKYRGIELKHWVYFYRFLLLCSQGWVRKCTPTHDQKSPHKTVTLCIFTFKSRVVHDTFSNWGDTPCVCKRYKCIWVRRGDNAVRILDSILPVFDLYRLTPPRSFACKLTGPQGRFEDAKCSHLQALTSM